jgi:hypothetical protein
MKLAVLKMKKPRMRGSFVRNWVTKDSPVMNSRIIIMMNEVIAILPLIVSATSGEIKPSSSSKYLFGS